MANRTVFIKHSAKGSTWKEHKYIKKVGDKYIYANSKNGSDDISSSGGSTAESTNSQDGFDLDEMAKKVIRGEFGNGAERKELLGDVYAEIQKRVNEILKAPVSSSVGEQKQLQFTNVKEVQPTTINVGKVMSESILNQMERSSSGNTGLYIYRTRRNK